MVQYINYYAEKSSERIVTTSNEHFLRMLEGTAIFEDSAKRCREIKTLVLSSEQINFSDSATQAHLNSFRLINSVATLDNPEQHYNTFQIPKKTGGVRTINAPDDTLKTKQRIILNSLNHYVLPHNAAYAYTTGRCAKDAIQVHQRAGAQWFLKLDIKDFFPAHNPEYLYQQLRKLAVFNAATDEQLQKLITISVLNNSLPQGSPISPWLTNICFTPIDEAIQNYSAAHEPQLCYTRYADDILITAPEEFGYEIVIQAIKKIFQKHNTPFVLNESKTRFGRNTGRNWNLGLMYNKDSQITIGHVKKKVLKNNINLFLMGFTNGLPYNIIEVYRLQGMLSYLNNTEPVYYAGLMEFFKRKFKISPYDAVMQVIRGQK